MQDKDIQALKALAEEAVKAPTAWPFYTRAFEKQATPQAILSLIALTEQQGARIAELEARPAVDLSGLMQLSPAVDGVLFGTEKRAFENGFWDARDTIITLLSTANAAQAGVREQANAGETAGIESKPDDPMRSHFTCTPTQSDHRTVYYKTKLGAHGPYSLYRNEAEALYLNLGKALGIPPSPSVNSKEGGK